LIKKKNQPSNFIHLLLFRQYTNLKGFINICMCLLGF